MSFKTLIITIIILALDQVSKCVVNALMSLKESVPVIKSFFYITYHHNYGAAWGFFENQTILLVCITMIAFIVLYRYMRTFKNNLRNTIAFGLLFGGVVGNLLDRMFLGYVRDFLDFYIFGYNFPIFNVSDMAITIGVGLLLLAIIKKEDKNEISSK